MSVFEILAVCVVIGIAMCFLHQHNKSNPAYKNWEKYIVRPLTISVCAFLLFSAYLGLGWSGFFSVPTSESRARDRLRNGCEAYNNGDYPAAISSFSQVISSSPSEPNWSYPMLSYKIQAYQKRGAAYRHLNEYDKSLADFKNIVRLDPQNASNYTDLGHAYHDLRRYAEEQRCYDEALRIKLGHERAIQKHQAIHQTVKDHLDRVSK